MTKPLPKVPDIEQIRNELERLYGALANPVDDLCVVFSTAYLDKQLAAMLKYVLVDDTPNSSGTLLASGSLASFGARINMTYCLGLISPYCYENLKVLSMIRNAFAHSIGHVKFTDQEITRLCNEELTKPNIAMVIPKPNEGEWPDMKKRFKTARGTFEVIVSTIGFIVLRDLNKTFLNRHKCFVKRENWRPTSSSS
jgi:DNA-binding MltR family transcriptional regulator